MEIHDIASILVNNFCLSVTAPLERLEEGKARQHANAFVAMKGLLFCGIIVGTIVGARTGS